MHTNSFFKSFFLLVIISVFTSCDKDYSTVGEDLIGDNNFELAPDLLSKVEASTKETGPIASNNLDINSLGVLDNKAFGQTTANFATQVQLAIINPTIDANLAQNVESVTLYIPYYTKKDVITNSDGTHVYALDSIYGDKAAKLKLSIYENEYSLGEINTEPEDFDSNYPQYYYTDQNTFFNVSKGTLLYSNSAFGFSEKEFVDLVPATSTTAATTTYVAPGMRLELDKPFFQDLLFNKSNAKYSLTTNDDFAEYFKGLCFIVEKADANGVLARMNFKKGTIVVKYKEKTSSTDPVLVNKSITLNLTGNTVNLLSNEPTTGTGFYSNQSTERLYLRGGEGSIVTIDLFNPTVDVVTYNRTTKQIESGSNSIPDDLDYIKEKGRLINDASLTFYIDQTLMAGVTEPSKIFLYDIDNQRIFSAASIEKDASGRGLKYKIGITDYIRGLVTNDNTSVKLGVSVAQQPTNIRFKKTKNAPPYSVWSDPNTTTTYKNSFFFPESSVISPLGTILHGTNSTDESKRLKLEIYYTKPK